MYTVTHHTASMSVPEYLENYVDIPVFLKACQACPNYGKIWSCPPYGFDVLQHWKKYKTLYLLASKIVFDKDALSKVYTTEEITSITDSILPREKQVLSEKLFEMEKQNPGSISLSAGSCNTCKNGCTRSQGKPCVNPDQMRYSLESLGANVGLTIEKLMGIKLEWMEENRLPHHFVLVSGLLSL